ncbi:MAG TPA: hypothetical protein VFT46_02385 [Holophagaceae bacterium]|nr:hypothetical protein [Holophagaceae bacterium]
MTKTSHLFLKAASGFALAGLLACSGGGGSDSGTSGGTSNPNAATKLAYTDPTPSSGQWALVKDAASTDTHLILDLVPPSDAVAGFGVGFTLTAGTGVKWTKVSGSDAEYVHNVAYTLGSGVQLIKGTVKTSTLTAGVFQKGLSTTPVSHGSGTVASVALDLAPGASKTASVTITPTVSKELQASGMQPMTVAVGTLSLQ